MTTHETAPAMRVPIGESVSCTLVRVLDERLVPCPEGEPGEIYLAGPALARGYLDRPEQTAERFLADPHGPPGSRMYRTGDLGMWGDGGLVHCGRADEQVKVRGFRVEPGELAAALEEIEGVREASALAAPGVEGPVLVAVVCGERAPADGELMAALRERLPGHMLPQRVLRLPRLPRTPVGKIDLQALRRAARAAGPTEPRAADGEPDGADEATSRVCALMAEVLGRPVRPGDDFFALGGHSLTALRLTALLEAQTGAPVPLRLLFDAPEPAALARRLAREGEDPAPAADGARAAEPEGAEPGGGPGQDAPSPAQERMLLLQDLAGGTAYTIPMHWRLRAPGLDPELLERAWRLLFRRHATLRCCYPRAGRGRRRRELDPAEVEIRTLRLPEEGAEDRTAALERTLRTAAREPFDLEREAPARLLVVPDERDGGAFDLGLFVHHAAADEHGLELLQRELTELLDALLSGRAAEAPPPPRSAAAVAAAQRRRLRERRDAELAAWRERLAGHAGSGELPADAHSGSGAGVAVCELPGLGPRELAAAARRLRLTPFMLSHAAVALALQRAGAGEDLVLASPVAGRQEPGAEALVDCATNTVPVRHRRIDEGAIADFAERTREAVLDALERQTVPFDEVQRACGGSSLSEVLVSSYHAERARTRSGPVECLSRPLPAEEAKAALSCTLVVGARAAENGPGAEPGHGTGTGPGHGDGARPADGSALLVEYDRSAFTDRRAQALAGAIGRLLEQLVRREPEVPLAKLELLAPAERALLAGPGAGEGHELPLETFGAHFLRAAERYAERPALTVDGVTIGYRELAARALATAGRIRAAGAGPEDVVAVATGRSADMVIAHLGVLLSGAAFLALDPEAPAARTATLLRELPPALVVLSGCRPPLPEAPALPVLRLDEPGPAAPPPSAPTAPAALDALAYIVFTSGTTGTPKPVGVSHRGVTKLIATQRARLGSAAGQRVLYYASPTFDAAFWQLCGTLCDGGELVVVPDACRLPGPELVSFIERERIDLVSVPPSVLGALPPQARLPKRVRLVVGAERLPASLARRWAARHPLVNAYGPSEATVNTCLHRCGPDEEEPVPIGRIDPGARGYIVDASLRLCPPDFPGELLIGGEGVARGYLGDPAKTAAAFIADPFVPGERCYRSGDRAVRRADGAIEFLGRLDDQIKLRGLRIEPGEIAAALEELPGVRQAAVLVRPGPGDRPQLVGYLVPEGADRPGGEQEVRAALRERLSAHLVPERIVAIERIPRLPSGKLDRRALPEPPAPERRAVREDDPGLAALCAAFATALELPRVHPDDDFFALGGSSLTAASLLHEVKVRTGRAPGFAELLAAPTPRGLAAATQRPDPLGPLLELRPQPAAEALAPVWFLPPLAGMSWCYAPLRRWLDPRRRMVGLQTPNLSGEEPAEEDFGRLTARWADAIRLERAQAAPAAPVHLVGWSFGGAAALGVAAQLQRRGVPTGLVAMLDSYPVAEWAERAPSEAESLRSALGMLGVDVSLAEAERLDARSAAELMARANPLLAGLESFEPKRMIDNFHAGPRLERSAVFGGYSGDLLVFTAERTAAAMASDWRAWRPFVDGRVRRVPVDAAHQDMVRERALETIGPALEEALRGLA